MKLPVGHPPQLTNGLFARCFSNIFFSDKIQPRLTVPSVKYGILVVGLGGCGIERPKARGFVRSGCRGWMVNGQDAQLIASNHRRLLSVAHKPGS